jgi:two-component system nitrate/nitrite response regulator NarL
LTGGSFNVAFAGSNAGDIQFSEGGGERRPHPIIIIDDGLNKTALDTCAALRTNHPEARLVVLADRFDFDAVVAAFRWGVDGYFVKEISSAPLVGALRLVALGEKVLPSEMATCMGERPFQTGLPADLADVNLSDREIEVLQLLILGCANKVIGRRLGICEATVKVHVKAALRKLHVNNRTQAAIWAVQRGLIGYDMGREPDAAVSRAGPSAFPGLSRANGIDMSARLTVPAASLVPS